MDNTELEVDKSKHIFISYGDDSFKLSKERIKKEAEHFGFEYIKIYSPDDLSDDFTSKLKVILDMKKGGGYWIWKPYFLKKALDNAAYGDVITYCDAGCTIQPNTHDRYNEYVSMLQSSDYPILSFQLQQQNKVFEWTKKDVLDYFAITSTDKIYNQIQLVGGIMIMIKTPYVESLINTYYNISITRPDLFIDGQLQKNHDGFKEHRHDQSIFTILRYLNGCVVVPDGSFPSNYKMLITEPFIASRYRV